jgi:GH35 family endo-1,4-beta-xylanase
MEFGPVRVLNYGNAIALKDLPRTTATYAGRAPDALWRKEALDRIAKLRTAALTVKVTDAAGQPVPAAQVSLKQTRSAFGFGTAVTAQMLTAQGTDGDHYRKIVSENFSRVVFENDMKMEMWEQSLKNQEGSGFRWDNTLKACDWLKKEDIGIRGHYLCWAPWEKWSDELRGEPDKIKSRVLNHIPRIAKEIGDRVIEWDAINHLAGWDKNIDEVTGVEFYAEVMRACRAATKLPLWVNEDQVFRPGRQQDDYYTRIQGLIAAGCKPDGIGNQAHFDSSFLPSPQEMLAVSDRFAALVPALEITEFDVITGGDESLEADFMRDCLILCYSHPAYTGFLIWGFWEGAHWKPDAALWRKDWSEKPAAAAWRDLITNQWATRAQGASNAEGQFSAAGAHFGTYEITATAGDKTKTIRAVLTKDATAVTIALP